MLDKIIICMALKFKHEIKVGLKTRGSEKERKVYNRTEIRMESDAKKKKQVLSKREVVSDP
jgi:hypothetical protein